MVFVVFSSTPNMLGTEKIIIFCPEALRREDR